MAAPCYHSFNRNTRRCELCGDPVPGLDPSRTKKTGRRSRAATRLEKFEQNDALHLLSSIGAKVYEIGRPRRQKCHACGAVTRDQGTRQTYGIPDLWVFLPIGGPHYSPGTIVPRPLYCWIEMKSDAAVKTKDGGLSTEQVEFRQFCHERSIPHVDGTVDAVHAFLLEHGFIRE